MLLLLLRWTCRPGTLHSIAEAMPFEYSSDGYKGSPLMSCMSEKVAVDDGCLLRDVDAYCCIDGGGCLLCIGLPLQSLKAS